MRQTKQHALAGASQTVGRAPLFDPSVSGNALAKVLLRRADLLALGIDVYKETLWRWEATGKFPRRVYLGHTVASIASEIFSWIEERAAERAGRSYRNHD